MQIWSLAVNKSQDQIVSAGADSVINIWKVSILKKSRTVS